MTTLKTDFEDGQVLYSGTTSDNDKLNGITNTINSGAGVLGEVRMFALSMTGAVTKATLQGYGWAICDGTTPTAQGISGATITTTPDLQHKFIRMSDDETSGGTGGSNTHNHQWYEYTGDGAGVDQLEATGGYDAYSYDDTGNPLSFNGALNNDYYTDYTDTKPPYYDVVYFIKVK